MTYSTTALLLAAAPRGPSATAVLLMHVSAGALAILFGMVALYSAKGERVHRKAGIVFVYAMITMGLLGAGLAAVRNIAPVGNVPVGILMAYLVTTALTTVRPHESRWLEPGLMLVALGVGVFDLTFGFLTLTSPKGTVYGLPPYPLFIFGSVALLAGLGDFRLIRSGGVRVLRGRPRLTRHLWRMSFALAVAALSLFIGQAKIIPRSMRILPLLMLPVVAVLVTMFYWLWRVRAKPAAISDRASLRTPNLRQPRSPRRRSRSALA